MASSRLGPPPGWRDCPKMGNIIADTFIPFKTPLDSRYDDWVPKRYRFDINMLFESSNSNEERLGMIINLANTDRYYDCSEVTARGCKYKRMPCQGYFAPPSEELTTDFIQRCARFIDQHPLELIGITCTHGFNRTGFLIVSYLVEKLDHSVDAAVELFAQARQPGIFKQDYLDELFGRYGDVNETPEAPPEPDWYNGP